MIVIEIKWLIIFVGLITLIFGGLLLILKKSSDYIKGPSFWATGNFLMGIGLIIFALYPWPIEYPNIVVSSFLIISSRSFYLAGIWQFKEKKFNYFVIISLPILSILVNTIFCLVNNLPSIRIAFNSSIFAFLAFYAFYEMLYPTEKTLKNIFRINSIAFFISGLIMIIRALYAFRFNEEGMLKSPPISIAFFISIASLQAILTYGFIIMVNTKVAEDLKKQIAIKDMFFSVIAHDLKNQINVITGFSDLLYKNINKQNTEKNIQFTGYIRQASLQTNALLLNLLDWSKIQNKIEIFSPEKLDLNELINEEIETSLSMSFNKQISVDYKEEKIPLIITADKNMLKTILRNLIINAIKFTNPGGQINIHAKFIPEYVEINVSDSGIGIEPEKLKKLFKSDAHLTTEGTIKEKGTGLGLLLCKEFVEKHHGKIWVESQFELGSSFKFTIPYTGE